MDRLPTRTFFLLGAYIDESHFSEESGLFCVFSSRNPKQHKQRKLYKRSAEKWQKVAISQKKQKSIYC